MACAEDFLDSMTAGLDVAAAAAPTSSAACSSNGGAVAGNPAAHALSFQAHAGSAGYAAQQQQPLRSLTPAHQAASSDEGDDDDEDEDGWPMWPLDAVSDGASSDADETDDACSSRKSARAQQPQQHQRRAGGSKQLRALLRRADGRGRRDPASSMLLLAHFIRLLLAVTARHAPPALAHQLRQELARQYAAAAAASGAAPIAISELLARLSPTLLIQLVLAFRSHRADRLRQQLQHELRAATQAGQAAAAAPPAAASAPAASGSPPPLKLGHLLEDTLTAAAERVRSAARVTGGSTTHAGTGAGAPCLLNACMAAPGQAPLQLPQAAALFTTQLANTSANSSCSEGSEVDVEGVMWQELAAACCHS